MQLDATNARIPARQDHLVALLKVLHNFEGVVRGPEGGVAQEWSLPVACPKFAAT